MRIILILMLLLPSARAVHEPEQAPGGLAPPVLIDDFESYEDGSLPLKWKYLHDGELLWVSDDHMRPNERFYVAQDGQNKVLRVYTKEEAVHLTMANEPEGMDWDIRTHPRIAWDWRALKLPPGAREDQDRLNDVGIGFYVIFSIDGWLIKRPKTIKYTYSSSLPVGTVVSYGKLKVIVVSSGRDGIGDWQSIERDVVADYQEVFGDDPPDRPLSIRLWSDTDNTKSEAEADYDNIRLLGPATG